MRIRSLAAVLGVATALAGTQTATAHDQADGASPPPPDSASQADLPRFKPGFLNRVWRFNGSVDSVGDGSLSMTLESIERLPKRFRTQDDELLDQDVTVLYSEGTRVYGPDGKLVHRGELERAEAVQIRGRLLRPRKWRANEDGDYVPTVRAKRIHVTAWVTGSAPVAEDESWSEEDDGEPGEGCHLEAVRRDAEGVPACW
jgi:hypothetical protein